MKTLLVYISLLLLLLPQCISRDFYQEKFEGYNQKEVPFDFNKPDEEFKLDDDLYEISGLTYLEDNRLGAIEDERGRLYIIGTKKGDIKRIVKFGKKADYEGVELVGEDVFVIESDGTLHKFEIKDSPDVKKYDTPFSIKNDVEGLGFDGKQLLVACKADGSIKGTKTKNKGIYSTSPEDPENSTELLFDIDLEDLQTYLDENDRKGKIREFDPSAIAFDRKSKSFYILSADHLLVVTNQKGKLREVVFLDPSVFRQPEGICFDDKGDLFLSSEGAGAKARLFKFNRQ